jgi:hypothetical protein
MLLSTASWSSKWGVKYWCLTLTACLLVFVQQQCHKSEHLKCSLFVCFCFIQFSLSSLFFGSVRFCSWVILITCRSFFRTSCHATHGALGRDAWRGLAVRDWFSFLWFGDNAIRSILIEVGEATAGTRELAPCLQPCLRMETIDFVWVYFENITAMNLFFCNGMKHILMTGIRVLGEYLYPICIEQNRRLEKIE